VSRFVQEPTLTVRAARGSIRPQTDTQSRLELVLIIGDGGEAPFPIGAASKYPVAASHVPHAVLQALRAKAGCSESQSMDFGCKLL
jgi:hypothetical protein